MSNAILSDPNAVKNCLNAQANVKGGYNVNRRISHEFLYQILPTTNQKELPTVVEKIFNPELRLTFLRKQEDCFDICRIIEQCLGFSTTEKSCFMILLFL